MKRISGVKKNDLTKVATSSDHLMKNKVPQVTPEASHTNDTYQEEDFEDVNFEDSTPKGTPSKRIPDKEQETHDHDINHETDEPDDDLLEDEEHTDTSSQHANNVDDAGTVGNDSNDEPSPEYTKSDSEIFHTLDSFDPKAKGQRGGNNPGQGGSHGFKPTSQILQKKSEPEQDKPAAPKVAINIGGLKFGKGNDTSSPESVVPTEHVPKDKGDTKEELSKESPVPVSKPTAPMQQPKPAQPQQPIGLSQQPRPQPPKPLQHGQPGQPAGQTSSMPKKPHSENQNGGVTSKDTPTAPDKTDVHKPIMEEDIKPRNETPKVNNSPSQVVSESTKESLSQASEESKKKITKAADSIIEETQSKADNIKDTTKLHIQQSADKIVEETRSSVQRVTDQNRSNIQKQADQTKNNFQQSVENIAESIKLSVEKTANDIESKATENIAEKAKKIANNTEESIKDSASKITNDTEQNIQQSATKITEETKIHLQNQLVQMQRQILALQQQLQQHQSNISTGSGETDTKKIPAIPLTPIPDSFMDQILDVGKENVDTLGCTYDIKGVEKILGDISSLADEANVRIYKVFEKNGDEWHPSNEMVHQVRDSLIQQHSTLFSGVKSSDEERISQITEVVRSTIEKKYGSSSVEEKAKLEKVIMDQVIGIGRLQPLMDDRDITEILVVGKEKVFCIANGTTWLTDVKFETKQELLDLANDIVGKIGKEINIDSPHVDAKLDNGTRVHIIIPPASANGDAIITMRKPPASTQPVGMKELVDGKAMSVEMVEFLQMCTKGKANIILFGETNSGKTTVTRAMANFFHPDERVISLEDTQELNLPNFHYVPLEAVKRSDESKNIGIHELFKDTLRMSPERLLVGEVRGKEGGDMIEAMQSGQRGGITTLHAGSPQQVVTRLVIMMSRAQFGISEDIMRHMIHDAIDIVIQCRRLPDGRRKITRITEIIPLDEAAKLGVTPFRDIFKFDQEDIEEDDNGKILAIHGQHNYKAHVTYDKRLRYFEFGVKIPEKFGGLNK